MDQVDVRNDADGGGLKKTGYFYSNHGTPVLEASFGPFIDDFGRVTQYVLASWVHLFQRSTDDGCHVACTTIWSTDEPPTVHWVRAVVSMAKKYAFVLCVREGPARVPGAVLQEQRRLVTLGIFCLTFSVDGLRPGGLSVLQLVSPVVNAGAFMTNKFDLFRN